jgi:hypothetical protein
LLHIQSISNFLWSSLKLQLHVYRSCTTLSVTANRGFDHATLCLLLNSEWKCLRPHNTCILHTCTNRIIGWYHGLSPAWLAPWLGSFTSWLKQSLSTLVEQLPRWPSNRAPQNSFSKLSSMCVYTFTPLSLR